MCDNKPEGAAAMSKGVTPDGTGRVEQGGRATTAGEARLADDLAAMHRFYALHVRLAGESDLRHALEEIVAAACDVTGTDRGYIRLDSEDGERREFVTHGYETGSPFIAHILNEGAKLPCDGERMIIEDVETFPGLAGTRDREVALAENIRAMQSTPICDRNDVVQGVLSNQFHAPHRPADDQFKLIDLLAWIAADYIARHKTNEALRDSEERYRDLHGELQHRVRNSLAVMRSIARRTAAMSDTVEDFSMHLDGRLASFARVQAAVMGSPSGAIDLRGIVIDELAAHAAREGVQAYVTGPDITLQPQAGERLALAFHELATNAVKFGSLSVAEGVVRISWTITAGTLGRDQLTICWDEDRPGDPILLPTRRGFGTELLEDTLAYELEAETVLDFRPSGLLCTIIVPIKRQICAVA